MQSDRISRDEAGRNATEALAYYRDADPLKVQKTAAIIAATPTDELRGSRASWAKIAGTRVEVTAALALVALMDEALTARSEA